MKVSLRIKAVCLALSLMVIISLGACQATEMEPLRLVLIPAGEADVDAKQFEPVRKHLEREIGQPVKLVVASDYSAVIEALKFGHAEMARLGPFSYVLATTQARVEPVARAILASTGTDSYRCYIIVKAGSDIKGFDDLKGKTFAFVDIASTSGYLIPNAMLIKAGIDPQEYFKEVFFAGSHAAVIKAVQNGTVDAGSTNEPRLQAATDAGGVKKGELVVIAQSGPIPNSPITVRSDLPESLKTKIQAAWLTIPEDMVSGEGSKEIGYVLAKDSDYDFIREVAEVLDLDLTKMK